MPTTTAAGEVNVSEIDAAIAHLRHAIAALDRTDAHVAAAYADLALESCLEVRGKEASGPNGTADGGVTT